MYSILGIINLNEDDSRIEELTYNRPIAAIPFAGRYRIIDFTISNMVNSGINHVFIFTRDKYRSITDHIQTGRAWDLERKNKGVFIFNPLQNYYPYLRSSDMDIISDYLDYIYYSKEKYVVISPSYFISRIDYSKMLKEHIERKADISVAYKKIEKETGEYSDSDCLIIGKDNRVIDIINKKGAKNVFMETIMMERKLFMDIINKRILGTDKDLLKDAVFQLKNNLKIFAYNYDGYLVKIDTINTYYKENLELLKESTMSKLFSDSWPVYTKAKDEPPVKYQVNAEVTNSMIASGCCIDGTVENSVLFRRVGIQPGVKINHCIVMQNSKIGENAVLEHVILDKNVVISSGEVLRGTWDDPIIIEKNQII
ncbi:MAG: glucose-1-phosphate adenylyltransferase subunit GlgD [Firmicutes bacterium]|nr:glucose-1-phosphate adenylyltransferase subunit GlgD [Bacillota bacterium]